MGEVQEQTKAYFELGCAVLPFNTTDKKPLVEWQKWQTQKQTQEELESLPWKNADGFAVICGAQLENGLYLGIVDFDTKNLPKETIDKGREIIKKFPITQMEQTPSGGLHLIYYYHEKPKTISAYHNEAALELIGECKLCVMAPSQNYTKLNDNTPTTVKNLLEIFEKTLTDSGVQVKKQSNYWFGRENLNEERYKGKNPPCIETLCKGAEYGVRNEYGIRLASYFLNFRKYAVKKTKDVLVEWNNLNSPPLTPEELEGLIKSALHGEYVYGCNDPILWKNCLHEICPIKPKDLIKFLDPADKERATQILEETNLLDNVLWFGRRRLIGEDIVLIVNFFEILSGQTKYPISAILEGYSGSGKNESIRAIKPLIPEEWLFEFTTSTPEAVKYIPEEFSGTLIIYEASAMESKTGTLGLRAIGEGESIETIYPMRDV